MFLYIIRSLHFRYIQIYLQRLYLIPLRENSHKTEKELFGTCLIMFVNGLHSLSNIKIDH